MENDNRNQKDTQVALKSAVIENSTEELATVLSTIDDKQLINDFLCCLLTPKELEAVAMRWQLVKEIKNGTTQREISRELGLSLCKITRGSRELKKEHSAFKQVLEIFSSLK